MKIGSVWRVLQLFAILLFAASCSDLKPIFLPQEATAPAVNRGMWADLDAIYARDWQVPLNEGPMAIEWRLRAIDSAMASIDLQSFIWKTDTVGNQIREHLLAAADRGVQVRILIDDSFLAGQDRWIIDLAHHRNIEYRIYNPYKRRPNGNLSRTLLNLSEFNRLDHRMHNKVMVVDRQVAIVGGRNLADEYFGLDPESNFRDMELLVGGPVVEALTRSFDAYWNDHWSFPIDAISHVEIAKGAGDAMLQAADQPSVVEAAEQRRAQWIEAVSTAYRGRARLLVDQPPARTPDDQADRPVQVAQQLRGVLNKARREIVIVSAYLVPTPVVTDVLRDAVARGVRVRLLTNSINSNNHITAHAAYHEHVRDLLGLGAQVHEMRVNAAIRARYILPPLGNKKLGLHAKYLIIDRKQVFVGSSNLDPRSLRINTEIGLLIEDRRLAERLIALTEPDFDVANSWQLALARDGRLFWIGPNGLLQREPARTGFQRIEEWFFAHLPIEDEI